MNKQFTNSVRSFAELGAMMGIEPKRIKEPAKKVCKKCGAFMERIPGTNTWACNGTIKEKDKSGKVVRERPCTNYIVECIVEPSAVTIPA